MDKAAQLQAILDGLSIREAVALARAVELQRALGEEKLPTETILTTIRNRLKDARPPRVPTVRRLVCQAFEDFLTDQEQEPRLPGLIPRSTIQPWWTGLARLYGPEIAHFETRLREVVRQRDAVGIHALTGETQRAAEGWTRRLLTELNQPKADPALRQIFRKPSIATDVEEIARLLGIAEPLRQALDDVIGKLDDARRLDGRRIIELTAEAITTVKQHYLALSEAHGMNSRYLALALLNRLVQPPHILRLGRALSWKQDDALVQATEFGIIGQRLMLSLERSSRDIAVAAQRGGEGPDLDLLTRHIERYMAESEALLGEIGFRRDSSWGETILQTRSTVASALDRELMTVIAGRVLALMPTVKRRDAPRNAPGQPVLDARPDAAVVTRALDAARFLLMLMQRGQRHGFAHTARDAVDQLGNDIEIRADNLIEALRAAPDNLAIVAQLQAATQVCDILFEDGRGPLIERRMRLARQSAGPRRTVYGLA
jgi:hypothetical protein